MLKSGFSGGSGGSDYELVEGGQSRFDGEGEWLCLRRLPAPIATTFRKLGFTSKQSLWRTVLPVIAVLLSASLFIVTVVSSLRYLKLSGIYLPAYRVIPPISEAQVQAAAERHLTNEQCLQLYPGLYEEADRVTDYWSQRGGVSMAHIDTSATRGQTARVLIYNNEMYVKHVEWERGSRTRATLALIQEALLSAMDPVPNVEFVIMTDDAGDVGEQLPVFVLDREAKQNWLWLMPDFGFNSWPEPKVGSYSEVVRKAKDWDAKMPWADKIPQLFWKGAFMVDIRRKLADLAKEYSWGAIEDVDWRNKATVMTMDEHCKYKFLGHVEGWAYSGRLKYILACRSVVVAHEMKFIQHFHHLINSTMGSPGQNLVVVPGQEWKDLPTVMDTLLEDDQFAEELADRSQKFWQHYISKQSVDCYWRYLFHKWAEVQRFTPELKYEDTAYVSFNLLGRTEWDPY